MKIGKRRKCSGFDIAKVGLSLCFAYCSTELMEAQGLAPEVFNTGVDDSGRPLANYSVDPHYKLIVSADANFPGPEAVVVDDTSFPIATGDWLASSGTSKWIAPQGNQNYGVSSA